MNVQRTASAAFSIAFESEEELREEHRANLSMGALRLQTSEAVALNTLLLVTLRGPSGAEIVIKATVVAALPDGFALAVEKSGDEILQALLPEPEPEEKQTTTQSTGWDRIRGLSQMEKILLASKADRSDRSLLLQDNDPRVLLSILRNPRLTIEEVARLTKSTYLTYQIADVIMKAAQWMASLDVRLGLIHNPKTPQAFAFRILPALPDSEVRNIARAGTSVALKQAALRRLQSKP